MHMFDLRGHGKLCREVQGQDKACAQGTDQAAGETLGDAIGSLVQREQLHWHGKSGCHKRPEDGAYSPKAAADLVVPVPPVGNKEQSVRVLQ